MSIFKRSAIGMEIDSKEIRIVQLEGIPDKPVLRAYAKYPLPEGVVKDGKVLKPGELGAAMAALWAKENIKCRDIILGVNNQDVIVRFAAVPSLPKDKLDNLIRYQSIDYIPIPIDEIELDYTVIGELNNDSGKQLKILLVAGRKNMLFDYIKALEAARLNISDIAVSMLTMTRIIPKDSIHDPIALINLSSDFGNIVIMNKSELGMARTFSYPSSLAPYLQRLSDTSSLYGSQMEETLEKICNFVAGEIRSSVIYYRNQYPDFTLQNIIMTGKLTGVEGFIPMLKQMAETNVSLFELEKYEKNTMPGDFGICKASDYAICTGLAIRGLEV